MQNQALCKILHMYISKGKDNTMKKIISTLLAMSVVATSVNIVIASGDNDNKYYVDLTPYKNGYIFTEQSIGGVLEGYDHTKGLTIGAFNGSVPSYDYGAMILNAKAFKSAEISGYIIDSDSNRYKLDYSENEDGFTGLLMGTNGVGEQKIEIDNDFYSEFVCIGLQQRNNGYIPNNNNFKLTATVTYTDDTSETDDTILLYRPSTSPSNMSNPYVEFLGVNNQTAPVFGFDTNNNNALMRWTGNNSNFYIPTFTIHTDENKEVDYITFSNTCTSTKFGITVLAMTGTRITDDDKLNEMMSKLPEVDEADTTITYSNYQEFEDLISQINSFLADKGMALNAEQQVIMDASVKAVKTAKSGISALPETTDGINHKNYESYVELINVIDAYLEDNHMELSELGEDSVNKYNAVVSAIDRAKTGVYELPASVDLITKANYGEYEELIEYIDSYLADNNTEINSFGEEYVTRYSNTKKQIAIYKSRIDELPNDASVITEDNAPVYAEIIAAIDIATQNGDITLTDEQRELYDAVKAKVEKLTSKYIFVDLSQYKNAKVFSDSQAGVAVSDFSNTEYTSNGGSDIYDSVAFLQNPFKSIIENGYVQSIENSSFSVPSISRFQKTPQPEESIADRLKYKVNVDFNKNNKGGILLGCSGVTEMTIDLPDNKYNYISCLGFDQRQNLSRYMADGEKGFYVYAEINYTDGTTDTDNGLYVQVPGQEVYYGADYAYIQAENGASAVDPDGNVKFGSQNGMKLPTFRITEIDKSKMVDSVKLVTSIRGANYGLVVLGMTGVVRTVTDDLQDYDQAAVNGEEFDSNTAFTTIKNAVASGDAVWEDYTNLATYYNSMLAKTTGIPENDGTRMELDLSTSTISFSGTTQSESNVTAVILKQGEALGDIKDVESYVTITSDENGGFSNDVKLDNMQSGYYELYISYGNSGFFKAAEAYFATDGEVTSLINGFTSATSATEIKTLLSNDSNLGILSLQYFNEIKDARIDIDKVSDIVYKNVKSTTLSGTIYEKISTLSGIVKLSTILEAYNAGLSDVVYNGNDFNYQDIIGISTIDINGITVMSAYNNVVSDNCRSIVKNAILNKNFVYKEDVITCFVQQTLLNGLVYPQNFGYAHIKELLTDENMQAAGMSVTKQVTDEIAGELAKNTTPYASVIDLQNAINNYIPQSSSNGGTSSGGGAGPGYSASSKKSENVYAVASGVVAAASNGFSDIANVEWAKDSIKYLKDKGIVDGIGENEYKPNDNVTREQLLKILCEAFDINGGTDVDFSDTDSSKWYYKYVVAGAAAGITNGMGDGRFGVGEYITRADIAVMCCRAAKLSADREAEISFADYDKIPEYAVEDIACLKELGIINGYPDNSFRAGDYCTRAEMAVIIHRLLNIKEDR